MAKTRRGELSRLNKDLSNLNKWVAGLPTEIGNVYLNFFLDRFKQQGFIDETFQRWQKRKENKGKNRSILVASGRLRRSIKMRTNGDQVIFSTSVPYAQVHNEGGQIKKSVQVRPYTRKRRGKKEKVQSHKRQVDTTIPQRQFMGGSAFADRRIVKNLERELEKLLG